GRSCGCRSLSGRGFVLVLMNGYRGALVGTGGAETARPPLQWPSRVVCFGGVTSVPGSGDRPGTVTRVARRPGGGVRCCRTSHSTRAAIPTAPDWPRTRSPRWPEPLGRGTGDGQRLRARDPGDAGSGAGRIGTAIPGERARVEFQRAGKAHGDGPE